jgi:hypothetical protein
MGDQRAVAAGGAAPDLLVIAVAPQREGRAAAGILVKRRRGSEGVAELIVVVFLAEARILVEPLGRQHLRRHTPALAAVRRGDAHAGKGLRAVPQGDDAEAEGQAQPHLPLVEPDLADLDL